MRTFVEEVKKVKPEYTIRMLLEKVEAPSASSAEITPQLKPFSHFTLGCNADDKTYQVIEAFNNLLTECALKNIFFTFDAIQVKNLTNDDKNPLWAIELKISNALRHIFASNFDAMMCPEMDGNLYLWGNETKCPHITLGKTEEDKLKGLKLLESGSIFHFNKLDYKRVGPHDPHRSIDLTKSHANPIAIMPTPPVVSDKPASLFVSAGNSVAANTEAATTTFSGPA